MGLIKKNELPNGVNLSYYRIVSLTTVVGVQSEIELAGYISQEKREEEQAAIIDPEIGCDVYIDTQYLVVDYDPDFSVNKAYALLKAMPEWEDAEDVIDKWAAGTAYYIGDRVMYQEQEYKCLQAHTSVEGQAPDVAVSLWARINNPDPDEIPVWVQPDSTNPYMRGDRVHFPNIDDPVYISVQDYNVFAPNVAGWELWEGGE